MISPKDAYKKAKKEAEKVAPNYPLCWCFDIGDRYAFFFSPEPSPPGLPIITVNKTSGDIGDLPIPPLENHDLLEKGKEISIFDHRIFDNCKTCLFYDEEFDVMMAEEDDEDIWYDPNPYKHFCRMWREENGTVIPKAVWEQREKCSHYVKDRTNK